MVLMNTQDTWGATSVCALDIYIVIIYLICKYELTIYVNACKSHPL